MKYRASWHEAEASKFSALRKPRGESSASWTTAQIIIIIIIIIVSMTIIIVITTITMVAFVLLLDPQVKSFILSFSQEHSYHLRFIGPFPGEPGFSGPPWFSSSTCYGRESSVGISDMCFYRPDVLPVTQPTVSNH